MNQSARTFGALLLVGGAYLTGTGLSGVIYLVSLGAAQKSGSFAGFLVAGLAGLAFGFFLRRGEPDEARGSLPSSSPPIALDGGTTMPSPAEAAPPADPDSVTAKRSFFSANIKLVLVGLAAASLPWAMNLLVRLLSLLMQVFPRTQGRSAVQSWVLMSVMIAFLGWAVIRSVRNAGLRWNPDDRRYMASYTLRGLLAFAIFSGICVLPWIILSKTNPSEGEMMIIGWGALLWMPIVGTIGFAIARMFVASWSLTRGPSKPKLKKAAWR